MSDQGKDISARHVLPPDVNLPGPRFAQQGLPDPAFNSEIELVLDTRNWCFYKSYKKLYDAAVMCYGTSNPWEVVIPVFPSPTL